MGGKGKHLVRNQYSGMEPISRPVIVGGLKVFLVMCPSEEGILIKDHNVCCFLVKKTTLKKNL